ncbi:MAG: NAD(P) transhydrogenase subunit alpha [Planctomycetota bacterium]|jgi:NAD(P) transhydrogenase subunit alpha
MATVFIPKECADGEPRVAATPETVGKLIKAGLQVQVEAGAGAGAFIDDASYQKAGAVIASDAKVAFGQADVILKVREPMMHPSGSHELDMAKEGSVFASLLVPQSALDDVKKAQARNIKLFSMNLVPRISRAQTMDALSSQANIAGYKAVLLAAVQLPRYFPLLMTAAGTVKPARVVIMGAGVAGLQAIATARRLGAQVWATDVRLAVKEQVESLGAKFIDVPGMEDLEDENGYAKPPTPEFIERQRQIVGDHIAECDVVITTALIPGRKAPILVPKSLVERMRPGSCVVDIAAEQGGNCECTVAGETTIVNGVSVIGPRNLPGSISVNASELYSRNIMTFFLSMVKEGELSFDFEDEVVAGACVVFDSQIKHGPTAELLAPEGAK